jgi:thiol-disulfide isomerase/thioredoxin
VNGPAIAAKDTTVVASWFTEADGQPRVRVAFSDDGGKDFSEPLTVANSEGASTPVGRVDVALAGDRAVVSWLDETGEGDEAAGAVKLRQVGRDGALGAPVRVAGSSPERGSGIPRVAETARGTVVAWRGPKEPGALHAKLYPEGTLTGSSADTGGGGAGGEEPRRPDVRATSVDGETVSLGDVDGPALVNLWATWCAPCKAEMPLLETVQNEWTDRGLRMIGLSVEGENAADKIETFVANNEEPFEVWYAPEREPLSTFGADAVPATYLYDSDGTVVWSHDGRIEEGELAALQDEIAGLVKE